MAERVITAVIALRELLLDVKDAFDSQLSRGAVADEHCHSEAYTSRKLAERLVTGWGINVTTYGHPFPPKASACRTDNCDGM
jgi:hypothetical protein